MHVGSVCLFEGTPLPLNEFADLIASRMDGIPRYGQRLAFVPFNVGRPVWVDDPGFDVSWHLRRVTHPPPGNRQQFLDLVGGLFAHPLDHGRPPLGDADARPRGGETGPVRARGDGERRPTGRNQVSFVFCSLPVAESDPAERLRMVSRRTARLKERREAPAASRCTGSRSSPPRRLRRSRRGSDRSIRGSNSPSRTSPAPRRRSTPSAGSSSPAIPSCRWRSSRRSPWR